jgi:hypothetical protein
MRFQLKKQIEDVNQKQNLKWSERYRPKDGEKESYDAGTAANLNNSGIGGLNGAERGMKSSLCILVSPLSFNS